MMKRFSVLFCVFTIACGISLGAVSSQEDSFSKAFRKFKDVIPGVDFFASNQAELAPFEKPIAAAREKLAAFLGDDLAHGAIVICSQLEQKDSVNEIKLLRTGYRWVLIQLTPEAANQQILATMKASAEGPLPPEAIEKLQNPSPEMKTAGETALVAATVRRFANAVISMSLAKEKEFRSSRLDDTGRSPLTDWLDIGLAAYVSESANSNLKFLQDRMEEAFPLEDVLGMVRPFVVPGENGDITAGPPAGGPVIIFPSADGTGPAPGAGVKPPERAPGTEAQASQPGDFTVRRGSPAPGLPKEVQDRMLFDVQAATFFNYLVQKTGVEKGRELIQWDLEGKDPVEFVSRADVFGPDMEKTEREWQSWIKSQKAPAGVIGRTPRAAAHPQ